MKRMVAAAILSWSLTASAADAPLPPPGTLVRIAFDRTSPYASSAEIIRRTYSPIAAARMHDYLAAHPDADPIGKLRTADERFALYIPPGDPPKDGWGLLVWISPGEEGDLPRGWQRVLDRHRLVFVSAERSGNTQDMLARRVPLALDAVANVQARVAIDPSQVWVAGFSGGSRTSMRLALTYPDVFRGAVLNSGADAFGVPGLPLPPIDLFGEFQQRSRLVLVTGTDDEDVLPRDDAMVLQARRLCVTHVERQPMLHTGHERMSASQLDRALDALERPEGDSVQRAQALEGCRVRLEREVDAELARARELLAKGDRKAAGDAITEIDAGWGGLAGPAVLDLAKAFSAK